MDWVSQRVSERPAGLSPSGPRGNRVSPESASPGPHGTAARRPPSRLPPIAERLLRAPELKEAISPSGWLLPGNRRKRLGPVTPSRVGTGERVTDGSVRVDDAASVDSTSLVQQDITPIDVEMGAAGTHSTSADIDRIGEARPVAGSAERWSALLAAGGRDTDAEALKQLPSEKELRSVPGTLATTIAEAFLTAPKPLDGKQLVKLLRSRRVGATAWKTSAGRPFDYRGQVNADGGPRGFGCGTVLLDGTTFSGSWCDGCPLAGTFTMPGIAASVLVDQLDDSSHDSKEAAQHGKLWRSVAEERAAVRMAHALKFAPVGALVGGDLAAARKAAPAVLEAADRARKQEHATEIQVSGLLVERNLSRRDGSALLWMSTSTFLGVLGSVVAVADLVFPAGRDDSDVADLLSEDEWHTAQCAALNGSFGPTALIGTLFIIGRLIATGQILYETNSWTAASLELFGIASLVESIRLMCHAQFGRATVHLGRSSLNSITRGTSMVRFCCRTHVWTTGPTLFALAVTVACGSPDASPLSVIATVAMLISIASSVAAYDYEAIHAALRNAQRQAYVAAEIARGNAPAEGRIPMARRDLHHVEDFGEVLPIGSGTAGTFARDRFFEAAARVSYFSIAVAFLGPTDLAICGAASLIAGLWFYSPSLADAFAKKTWCSLADGLRKIPYAMAAMLLLPPACLLSTEESDIVPRARGMCAFATARFVETALLLLLSSAELMMATTGPIWLGVAAMTMLVSCYQVLRLPSQLFQLRTTEMKRARASGAAVSDGKGVSAQEQSTTIDQLAHLASACRLRGSCPSQAEQLVRRAICAAGEAITRTPTGSEQISSRQQLITTAFECVSEADTDAVVLILAVKLLRNIAHHGTAARNRLLSQNLGTAVAAFTSEDSRPSIRRLGLLSECLRLLATEDPKSIAKTTGAIQLLAFDLAERPLNVVAGVQRDRIAALRCIVQHDAGGKVLLSMCRGEDLFVTSSAILDLHLGDEMVCALSCAFLADCATNTSVNHFKVVKSMARPAQRCLIPVAAAGHRYQGKIARDAVLVCCEIAEVNPAAVGAGRGVTAMLSAVLIDGGTHRTSRAAAAMEASHTGIENQLAQSSPPLDLDTQERAARAVMLATAREPLRRKIVADGVVAALRLSGIDEAIEVERSLLRAWDNLCESRACHRALERSGVLVPMLSAVGRWADDVDIQLTFLHSVLLILEQSADDAVVVEWLAVKHGRQLCRHVISVMSALRRHEDVQAVCCRTLRELTRLSPGNCLEVSGNGGVEALGACSFAHKGNSSLQVAALGTIADLAADGDPRSYARLLRCGGPGIVVAALDHHAHDAGVAREGCKALANICARPKGVETVMQRNVTGHVALMAAIVAHEGDDTVVEYGAAACAALAPATSADDRFLEYQVITLTRILLSTDTASPAQLATAASLSKLCRSHARMQALMMSELALVDLLVGLLGYDAGITDAKPPAVGLELLAVAAEAEVNRAHLAPVAPQVLDCLRARPDHRVAQEHGLNFVRLIAENVPHGARAELLEMDVVRTVLVAVEKFKHHGRIAEVGCAALANLAETPLARATIASHGGVEVLLRSMSRHQMNPAVSFDCAWALQYLCETDVKRRCRLLEAGGLRTLSQALRRAQKKDPVALERIQRLLRRIGWEADAEMRSRIFSEGGSIATEAAMGLQPFEWDS